MLNKRRDSKEKEEGEGAREKRGRNLQMRIKKVCFLITASSEQTFRKDDLLNGYFTYTVIDICFTINLFPSLN